MQNTELIFFPGKKRVLRHQNSRSRNDNALGTKSEEMDMTIFGSGEDCVTTFAVSSENLMFSGIDGLNMIATPIATAQGVSKYSSKSHSSIKYLPR